MTHTVSRRELLKTSALVGSAVTLGGCERILSAVTDKMAGMPESFGVATSQDIDPCFHLLSRAAYGPRPGDLDRLREIGAERWIDEQLEPEKLGDLACTLRARRFETLHHAPGTCKEYKPVVLRQEIARHTLLRAVYSQRQLFEVMVGFWTDHLNIQLDKGDCIYFKPWDDQHVVRKHALGSFQELIRASATSPAMLVYLDGIANKKGKPGDVPNENYARELLELHTLGVHGGYSQKDVYEVARCLTGWRIKKRWNKGAVYFAGHLHDDGAKTVLGQTIPAGGGASDLDRVVDIVCTHPATARHIATKLVRRFVSEDPPAALVARVAATFTRTGGQIKPLLREILTSEEFGKARGLKIKRPFRLIVSALRALGADTHARSGLIDYLDRMGQQPFGYPTPDGYPDEGAAWMGTLLWRWNFAFELAAGRLGGVRLPRGKLARGLGRARPAELTPGDLVAHLAGRTANQQESKALTTFAAKLSPEASRGQAGLIGLILAAPAFQRY